MSKRAQTFVRKRQAAIDRGAASAVTIDKVTALHHEILDDAMERGAFVADGDVVFAVLAGAKLAKILGSSRTDVGEKFKCYAADRKGAYVDVKEDNRIGVVMMKQSVRGVVCRGCHCLKLGVHDVGKCIQENREGNVPRALDLGASTVSSIYPENRSTDVPKIICLRQSEPLSLFLQWHPVGVTSTPASFMSGIATTVVYRSVHITRTSSSRLWLVAKC